MSQSMQNKSIIRRGLPVSAFGLTFHPITMENYEIFLSCKDALTVRQGSLPVRYLSMDYLSALFALEQEKNTGSGKSGFFAKTMKLLDLSLRIGSDNSLLYERILFEADNGLISLKGIKLMQENISVTISPRDYSDVIRPIIAELNGVELPDESHNIDLIRANEKKASLINQNVNLNVNIDDLIASVAYQSHLSEREIYDWTVREFENRKKAIERDKRYMLYAQAEMSGMVTFKNGNPAPSWYFDKIDESLGTMSLDDLGKQTQGISQQQ